MSIRHWSFERLSSVDFQESTIICSPSLVIHQADILSNMRTAQFYAMYIYLGISLNQWVLYSDQLTSLLKF